MRPTTGRDEEAHGRVRVGQARTSSSRKHFEHLGFLADDVETEYGADEYGVTGACEKEKLGERWTERDREGQRDTDRETET